MMLEDCSDQSKADFRLWLSRICVNASQTDGKVVCIVCDSGSKGGVEDFLIGFANKQRWSYYYNDVEFKIFELGNVNSVVGMEFQKVILYNNPEIDYDAFKWLKSRVRGHNTGEAVFADLTVSDGIFHFWQY